MLFKSPTNEPVHIALKDGNTVLVTAEGVELHPRFHREAIARGCRVADLPGGDAPPDGEPEPIDRRGVIAQAIEAMLDDSAEGDFTGDGKPNLAALSKRAGFQVSREERDAVWADHSGLFGSAP